MWIQNYNEMRISDVNADVVTWCAYGFIILLGVWGLNKRESKDTGLSLQLSEMVKGVAMFGIVVHHLFVHVLDQGIGRGLFYDVGFWGVAVFMFLSGYGMSFSAARKGISHFWYKRFVRVFLPAILFTAVWLMLDVMVWGQTHTWPEILRYVSLYELFDRNYWFVQFLFVNYLVFWILHRFGLHRFLWMKYGVFLIFFWWALHNNWVSAAKVNMFSFWVGMEFFSVDAFGKLENYLNIKNKFVRLIMGGLGIGSVYLLVWMRRTIQFTDTWDYYVMMSGFTILSAVLFVLGIKYLYGHWYSRGWVFMGNISFGLFLAHGALMYTYDMVLWLGPLVITFWIYMIYLIAISWIVTKGLARLTALLE